MSEEQQHDKAPWTIGERFREDHLQISTAIVHDAEYADDSEDGLEQVGRWIGAFGESANIERVVAAVNACEGIPTEALEAGTVAELLAVLHAILRTDNIRQIRGLKLNWEHVCHMMNAATPALTKGDA